MTQTTQEKKLNPIPIYSLFIANDGASTDGMDARSFNAWYL